MAKEKVDITADADVARAIEKLVAIAREYGKIGDAAAESGEKGSRGAKTFAASMDGLIGKWVSVSKGIELSLAALKMFLAENAKLRAEQVGATRTIDTGLRGYQSAAGNLSDAAAQEAAGRILAVAQQSKASVPAAFGAASLLARFQVGRPQAEGPALAELLQFQNVAKAGGQDAEGLSAAVVNALQRAQRPITGDTIRKFGAATLGLSRQIKGFDAGEIGITADVASYGRNAGLDLEETAAIVGILSEEYGEGGAKRTFKSLFKDSEFTREEKQRIAGLRARAAGLMRGSERDYAAAAGIYSGSMAAEEEQAETQYAASGYRPGALDSETVRKRYLAARRDLMGSNAIDELIQGTRYDWLQWFGGPEYAIRNLTSGYSAEPRSPVEAQIRERALGRQDFTVRLVLPDGRDVPSTTSQDAAAGLGGFSTDPTQYENFRP